MSTFEEAALVNAKRVVIEGEQILAAVVEYSRSGGRWLGLITVRVKNNIFCFYEAHGLPHHLALSHAEVIGALANVRMYGSLEFFDNAGKMRANLFSS